MTTFRSRTADLEAAQFTPTDEEPLTFSDRPEWLEEAIRTRKVTVHPKTVGGSPDPHLTVQAHSGPAIVAPGDWIIRELDGKLRSRAHEAFVEAYEPFDGPEQPEKPEPGKTGAHAAAATGGAAS